MSRSCVHSFTEHKMTAFKKKMCGKTPANCDLVPFSTQCLRVVSKKIAFSCVYCVIELPQTNSKYFLQLIDNLNILSKYWKSRLEKGCSCRMFVSTGHCLYVHPLSRSLSFHILSLAFLALKHANWDLGCTLCITIGRLSCMPCSYSWNTCRDTRLLWPEHVCFISCSLEGAWSHWKGKKCLCSSARQWSYHLHASYMPIFHLPADTLPQMCFCVCSRDRVCPCVCKGKKDLLGSSGINHWRTVIRNVIGHIDQVPTMMDINRWWLPI